MSEVPSVGDRLYAGMMDALPGAVEFATPTAGPVALHKSVGEVRELHRFRTLPGGQSTGADTPTFYVIGATADEGYRRALETKAARLLESIDMTGVKPIDLIPFVAANATDNEQKES